MRDAIDVGSETDPLHSSFDAHARSPLRTGVSDRAQPTNNRSE
jgi:hypothetical protein